MRNLIKYINFSSLIFLLSSAIFGGCSQEDSSLPGNLEEPSDPVRVGGKISSAFSSRAYQKSGTVSDGQYYLTYTSKNPEAYQVATVNFGNPASPSTGIVTTYDYDELRWDMVGGSGNTLMFLDNVKGSDSGVVNNTSINFTPDYRPFVAAVFDSIQGSNDLLWGSIETIRGSKRINFPLYHNMSRLRVIVTADATNEVFGGEVGLDDGATVKLTNIGSTPESYNRLNGELYLGEDPVYDNLVLVDNTENRTMPWSHTYNPEPTNPSVKTFITHDFVLPPQLLRDNEERPRLVITTSAGKVFSGYLPNAMLVEYPDQDAPYPVALAFLSKHILTIQTEISQDPPELIFMPVKVIDWVDKGEWLLEGHQAGIYLRSDFMDLLSYYQAGNIYQLARFGFEDNNGLWTFNFWGGTVLYFNQIANSMPLNSLPVGMTGFEFVTNGYTQTVIMPDGTSTVVTAQQLYRIVTIGEL